MKRGWFAFSCHCEFIPAGCGRPTISVFASGAFAELNAASPIPEILIGTIVRDYTMIIATVKKLGWNVDLLG